MKGQLAATDAYRQSTACKERPVVVVVLSDAALVVHRFDAYIFEEKKIDDATDTEIVRRFTELAVCAACCVLPRVFLVCCYHRAVSGP